MDVPPLLRDKALDLIVWTERHLGSAPSTDIHQMRLRAVHDALFNLLGNFDARSYVTKRVVK